MAVYRRIKYEDVKGAFDHLPEAERQAVQELVADFHFMDGTPHEDGSRGTIRISPGQFRDCLAAAFMSAVESDFSGPMGSLVVWLTSRRRG